MSYQLPSAFLQKFTPKEIHELKRVFKEHDHDYAAAITVGELHTVLLKMGENVAPSQVTTILKQVQLERSSHITFQEFLHLFYDLRNGGIALDPATLIANVSIAPIPSTASTPVASAPSTTVPSSAPVVQQVPFFPNKSAWPPSHDDQDDDDQHDEAATNTFAAKPQWPPAGTTSNAKPTWQSATKPTPTPPKEASKWPPTNTTTPTTTAPSPTTKPTWPPTNANPSTAPSPNAKPQWPPAAAQANTAPPVSPSKKTWPPTQANAAPTSPSKPTWPPTQPTAAPTSPSKPSWPPAAKPTAPTSPSKPSWPPSQPAATPASPPKPQWPPAAPSPARQEPSPSQKPKWPPAGTAAPTPPTPTLDSHAIGVLERRASAVALYNANTTGTIHHVDSKSTSSKHSYSEEETAAFTEHINNCLQHDKDLSGLVPIRATNGLFQSVSDGVLLCKLVNAAVPETIDERAVNVRKVSKPQLNVYEMTENQNLCINAAKSIGCSVVNIGPTDLIEGRPILVLGLVWQIIKIQLTATINLKNHPELVRLLLDGESLEEFMKLPPDQILLRWMNYHLKAAGHPKQVTNFSSDVQDAHAYSVLLHQIAPQSCDLCRESIAEDRAAHVIQNARKLDIETFLKPRDITSGNPKLNMSFVAQLFNTCPALDVVEAELKQLEEILYDDSGDTREERVFRMWINSLGIDDVYINHLFSDVRDGINLLKVLDKIEKGIVAWQKVNLVAPNKFKQVENCNYCVVLGKQLKFSLVNIGGADIFEGNKKLILSVIWQSMRHFQLKLLSELAAKTLGHREITDNDIIQWANAKVAGGGKPGTRAIVAFRDLSLADGLYLLSLIHAVEPRAVNWEMVTTGQSDDDKNSNAKYAISCAQKIGATVFVTYEDIVEVKPKMIMTFVASLMSVDMHRR